MTVVIEGDAGDARLAYAARRLRTALPADASHRVRLVVDPAAAPGGEEAYAIRRDADDLMVQGGGGSGVIYGALALAEDLRHGVAVADLAERRMAPAVPFRAIKFNLPWMSYRNGPSLQLHDRTCRDPGFWTDFLDMMADNRFNTLTLWSLHPFHLMFRPAGFPEACDLTDIELAEWQAFWRGLFARAAERGIATYLVTWNIFVSPAFAREHGVATYSITGDYFGEGDASDLVKRYTRQCVTQVLDEYPDLTGLGITHAERMAGMTPAARQSWIEETWIAGMRAAKRPARLIHRLPMSAGREMGGSTSAATELLTRRAIEALDLPAPIWVEMKFNWSHGHSTPHLVQVHGGPLTDALWHPPPTNYRITWMVRNEDFFILRWGEPDFIRRHLAVNGGSHVGGWLVGSECYIPAVDYFPRPAGGTAGGWAFERQWLFYHLWGRLLYDPATPDAAFATEFRHRHGAAGDRLFAALRLGSRVPLRIASFHRPTWDFTLYAEGFLASAPSGGTWDGTSPFISVDELIDHPVLAPDFISIPDFVAARRQGAVLPAGTVTPLALADELDRDGDAALILLADLPDDASPLGREATDARAWAHLGRYFAAKLRGAVALADSRQGGGEAERQAAETHLLAALGHWRNLVAVTATAYLPMPLLHLGAHGDGLFHWSRFLPEVERDLELARRGGR
jgi:hypothetical protein